MCSRCLIPVANREEVSVNIGGGATDLVDRFCYLGDMLSVDGSADVAVTVRIQSSWNKFRQLSVFLTPKGTPLTLKGMGVQ